MLRTFIGIYSVSIVSGKDRNSLGASQIVSSQPLEISEQRNLQGHLSDMYNAYQSRATRGHYADSIGVQELIVRDLVCPRVNQ